MSPEVLWLAGAGLALILALAGFIWRDLAKRVEKNDNSKEIAALAKDVGEQQVRTRRIEADYQVQHDWKNKILPHTFERQNTNILSVMHRIESDLIRRLDRVEKYLNGHLK